MAVKPPSGDAASQNEQRRCLGWPGKLALSAVSAGLLTLAFAPVGQFYLAWLALAPWLILVGNTRRARGAFWWSWWTGILFFAANMWWLTAVTWPGAVALILYLGLYFGAVGWVVRVLGFLELGPKPHPRRLGKRLLKPPGCNGKALCFMVFVAILWVGAEWTRGTLFTGLPWLLLGYTQTPWLAVCQIADVTGVYGVSLAIALVNALLALAVLNRTRLRELRASVVIAVLAVGGMVGYGTWRMGQTATTPGPRVMVVQSNFPQKNTGEKGATYDQIVDFHLQRTREALAQYGAVDLIVWSETMVPPVNAESREALAHTNLGPVVQQAHAQIGALAREAHAPILVGTDWETDWHTRGDLLVVAADRRNSVMMYGADGELAAQHYDKIHLVPFGEYTPFKDSVPPLYQLLLMFNPYEHPEDMNLTPGAPDALSVFTLADGRRFVTPICFEDIEADLVAQMLRPGEQKVMVTPSTYAMVPGDKKRADFIVNLTNDGWFTGSEMPQHLQAAVFRSIENHAPTARSVNTGISGFIDSVGRTADLVGAGVAGASVHSLMLDARLSVYTQYGDVVGVTSAAASGLALLAALVIWRRRRVIAARKS